MDATGGRRRYEHRTIRHSGAHLSLRHCSRFVADTKQRIQVVLATDCPDGAGRPTGHRYTLRNRRARRQHQQLAVVELNLAY